MYRLICQKPANFLSAQVALVSTFFQMFIVLGMYNFDNRYNSPDRQKNKKKGGGRNRNYDHGKPATIYQIGATTELSTNDDHRLKFVN